MEIQVTPGIGAGGGYWLPVYTLLTTCRLRTSNICGYGE